MCSAVVVPILIWIFDTGRKKIFSIVQYYFQFLEMTISRRKNNNSINFYSKINNLHDIFKDFPFLNRFTAGKLEKLALSNIVRLHFVELCGFQRGLSCHLHVSSCRASFSRSSQIISRRGK